MPTEIGNLSILSYGIHIPIIEILALFSLVNMYKELVNDIDGFEHPGHGNLTGWAKQGLYSYLNMIPKLLALL